MTPACDGASRSISRARSSRESKPRSPPRRRARSAAIIQSGRAVPGAVTFWPRRVTRPSMLVVVPVRSPYPAAGRTTSAPASDGPSPKRSMATVKPTPASASRARVRSGKSLGGVGAHEHQALDLAARRRRPGRRRCPCPAPAGGGPTPRSNQARPSSSDTRPGRMPGARPMSRAPCTLPRRRAGRKRASGSALASTPAASATLSAVSASDARPSTITTDSAAASSSAAAPMSAAETPPAPSSGTRVAARARATVAASPGRYWSRTAACLLRPVACGVSSISLRVPSTAASRSRR